MVSPKAAFVGNGALLLQCVEVFLAAGGEVSAVITSDQTVLDWVADADIPGYATLEDASGNLSAVDYLFSVANLTKLPDKILGLASQMAINFHDGKLPERAGVNAPVWALFEGAKTHSVTWHEMTSRLDAGRILKEKEFPVAENETAFTLNAQCFEAGLELFGELVKELNTGQIQSRRQSGKRGWYAAAKRPEHLGTLDLSQPAEALGRVARALDFGSYANPVAVAKLWTGERLLAIGGLTIAPGHDAPSGTVISSDQTSVTMAVGDGSITVTGLTDMSGDVFTPDAAGLVSGKRLPPLDFAAAPAPDSIGESEPFWRSELEKAHPAIPPYPRDLAAPAGGIDLAADATGPETIAAAWMAWVAGLTGQTRATVAFADHTSDTPWLLPLAPVSVDIAPTARASEIVAAVTEHRQRLAEQAPIAADLPLRIVDPAKRDAALSALRVVVSDAATSREDADLVIDASIGRLTRRAGLFTDDAFAALVADFSAFLAAMGDASEAMLADLPLGRSAVADVRGGPDQETRTIHAVISEIACTAAETTALEAGSKTLSYADLEARADRLAGAIAARGAGPGAIVGLCLPRSADLVVAMLAILKTGAAYLPIDPAYPSDRVALMLSDSGAPLVVSDRATTDRLALDAGKVVLPDAAGEPVSKRGTPEDLAYLIYTSGSTGRPKGVMVRHRNVTNFFAGMDAEIPLDDKARLLAVASVSFDISVLEILWTLTRGATVVLQSESTGQSATPDFSLFFFASESAGAGHDAYRLLLEGARFADENGFEAIWTPERHFHAFGGLYPNPAICAAALSGMTKNIKLRAGSSVLPLHHPVRVAEDWALVDNLSNGRAGVALASGWQPNDFLVRPESFERRKEITHESVDTLRRLWRGEEMSFPGHDGKPVTVGIHPRPVQKEIPLWLTAAGNPETFEAAGRQGCGVLTHLLGQTIEELAEKIRSYRIAWVEAGHEGQGSVVLMLHTFVGESEAEVIAAARQPMKTYLKSAVDLVRRAAWTFPTIVERAGSSGATPQEIFDQKDLLPEELDALLDHAFERYYGSAGLFGTPETAREIVQKLTAVGVNEIACLIDFGIDSETVLKNLPNVRRLIDGLEEEALPVHKASVSEEIATRGITHLQCTPSMANFLVADASGRNALSKLDVLMVGGEALPVELARKLRDGMSGQLFNMYGPTETTIWSSVARLDDVGARVSLGGPVLNTSLSVRSAAGRELPDLVEGELWIGGAGVAQGYWQRPELTEEHFVETGNGVFYRTGDTVRRLPNGSYEFLGRIDGQIKIRGHRVETGEIESILESHPSVSQAVVVVKETSPGDVRLIAYATPADVSGDALRDLLSRQVPSFMVPSDFVSLAKFPLTPNGKIDRNALSALGVSQWTQTEIVSAEGDLEQQISLIWSEALGRDRVSVTENFFDLGGHSLLVIQVQRKMQEVLACDVAITDLFRYPTVRGIAEHLAQPAPKGPSAADRGGARASRRRARMGRR